MAKDNNLLLWGGLAALGVLVFSSTSKASGSDHSTFKLTETTPTDFIINMYKQAWEVQKKTGFPILHQLTQAGIESGWGKHAPGFNYYGIKADKSWTGDTQLLTTKEFYDGAYHTVKAKFRAYDNPALGFYDHVKFLKENPRYKTAMANMKDTNQFFIELGKAGYATAPNYSEVLIKTAKNVQKVIDMHNLTKKYGDHGGSW